MRDLLVDSPHIKMARFLAIFIDAQMEWPKMNHAILNHSMSLGRFTLIEKEIRNYRRDIHVKY